MRSLNCNIFLSMEGLTSTDSIPTDKKIALASKTSEKGMSVAMLSFNKDREFELRVYAPDINHHLVMIHHEITQEWEGQSDRQVTNHLFSIMDEKVLEFELSDEYEEERE